jgi:two-component system chemotaxis sensor kinase CheA
MDDESLNELLNYFFEESFQLLKLMENSILEIEKDNSRIENINDIFRAVHTIKGSSGSLDLKEIASFAHVFEDSLDFIRNNPSYKINSEQIDTILEGVDILDRMIKARSEGSIYSQSVDSTKDKLISMIRKDNVKDNKNSEKSTTTDAINQDLNILESEVDIFINQIKPGYMAYKAVVTFSSTDPMASVGPLQIYSSLRDIGIILKTFPSLDELNSDKTFSSSSYLFVTNKNIDSIKRFIDIPDIVTSIKIEPIDLKALKNRFILERESTKSKNNQAEDVPFENSSSEKKFSSQISSEINENRANDENIEEDNTIDQKTASKDAAISRVSTILRVDSSRIDELMNLVSQIVINKAALIEITSKIFDYVTDFDTWSIDASSILNTLSSIDLSKESSYTLSTSQLKKILSTFNIAMQIAFDIKSSTNSLSNELQVYSRTINLLQEGVMKIRMVPIEQMFSRFPRIVRDLCRKLGKDAQLVMNGGETELDKSIIEELSDPMMHILRNCMDHGIEDKEIRASLSKPVNGTITINARNEGNVIVISVEDDGAGIDIEKIRKKAIDKNLISPQKILSESEAYELLFKPGFSTSDKISDVSGRGVGLDVVKKALELLNGTISVESEKNKYTRFTIKLPLTLAIIQALMVSVGEEVFAIPINNIYETKRVDANEIFLIEGKKAIKIREEIISVLYLNDFFNLDKNKSSSNFLVVVGFGERKVGLVVDNLIGSLDIVIKPLKNSFTRIPGLAGSAILGNGEIALIIDVGQMIESIQSITISSS